MTPIALEPAPVLPRDLLSPAGRSDATPDDLIYVGSGKSAIALILGWLGRRRVLPHKMTPVLVPPWLGTWVYAQMLNFAMPTTATDAAAPVVFCYHQYGFPQDMDKVLSIARDRGAVVVEDCAHAADSLFRGRPLGRIGAFGLFSFSKFAFCHALGAVCAQEPEFADHVRAAQAASSRGLRLFVNGFKLADEANAAREKPVARILFDGVRNMAYARYGDQHAASPRAIALWESKRAGEFAARRENYRIVRDRLARFGLCEALEAEGVTPYVVPLAVDDARRERVVTALRENGVRTGAYRFDVARCVYEPDFRPHVLLPIHSRVSGAPLDMMIETIVKAMG